MKKLAMIIGINHYDDKAISPLKYAENDASAFKDLLIHANCLNIPEENIDFIIGKAATKENIIAGLNNLIKRATDKDIVFFFFSGHGSAVIDKKEGDKDDGTIKFLVPYNAKGSQLKESAITFKNLTTYFHKIKAQNTIIFLDCCYSGRVGGRSFLAPGIKDFKLPVGELFLQQAAGVGRSIISACERDELAYEGDACKHGYLSNFLINGLKGKADILNDGVVDFNELWTYIASQVPRVSKGQQHPVMVGWLRGPAIELTRPVVDKYDDTKKQKISDEIILKFNKFRLQHVKIADNSSIEELAKVAAEYLDTKLTSSSKICVSCGRTLHETITRMKTKNIHNVEIYPLNVYLDRKIDNIDSNQLITLLTTKIKGKGKNPVLMSTFYPWARLDNICSKNVFDALKSESDEIFADAKTSDIYLLGIGQPTSSNANVNCILHNANLSNEEIQKLGVVGEISYHLYDENGEFIILKTGLSDHQKEILNQYYKQFFAFPAKQFNEIKIQPGIDLIVVAGGDDKQDAILGAIKGKLVRTLITDVQTARWLAHKAIV